MPHRNGLRIPPDGPVLPALILTTVGCRGALFATGAPRSGMGNHTFRESSLACRITNRVFHVDHVCRLRRAGVFASGDGEKKRASFCGCMGVGQIWPGRDSAAIDAMVCLAKGCRRVDCQSLARKRVSTNFPSTSTKPLHNCQPAVKSSRKISHLLQPNTLTLHSLLRPSLGLTLSTLPAQVNIRNLHSLTAITLESPPPDPPAFSASCFLFRGLVRTKAE